MGNGADTDDRYTKDGVATCEWWLRTPGDGKNWAASVTCGGGIREGGCVVNLYGNCVRPAIWISLEN